jgi:hypothetical protein
MTHPVLVASFADEVEVLARWWAAQPAALRRNVTAVGLDLEAQAAFRRHGFETRDTLPFLNEESHRTIFLSASRNAREWFRTLPEDTLAELSHDGVHYPECLEYDISLAFTEVFLHAELLRAILEIERPGPLVVVKTDQKPVASLLIAPGERLLYPIACEVCAPAGVALQTVVPPKGFPADRRKLAGLKPLLRKAWDMGRAICMEERPLAAFLSYSLPVALSFFFPGKIIYRRKLRRYGQASRKVLFWGGTKAKERIRQELQRDPAAQVLILEENGRLRFRRFLVPRVDPRQVCSIEAQAGAAIRDQAEGAWDSIAADHLFQEQLRYGAIRLWPILRSRLEFLVRVHFPQCVEFYEATRQFLRKYGGDVLVSSLDVGGFTPWVCQAFASLGKESVYFWHGLMVPHPAIEEGLSPAFLPLKASRVAAFGTGIADWYRSKGVASERIQVVGFPDLDSHRGPLSPKRRRSICRILSLRPDKPIVVYAASVTRYGGRRAYSEETADEILRATQEILQELATNSDLQVVIKLHPGSTAAELASYQRLARPFSSAVVCQMPDISWLLQLCDILITYQSSTGIEALAYDKNVIIYNTTGRANQYSPQAMRLEEEEPNFVVLVDNRRQLRTAVEKLLTAEALREKLRAKRRQLDPYILFNSDGEALDRAMRLLAEAAAGGKTELRNQTCPKTVSLAL